jgi:diguanylate cyclase (GGDEF)-like protein/PAS domain S-box-containing protein
MFRVYSCLAFEHDHGLVALAAVVCLFASGLAMYLLNRLRALAGLRRAGWLAVVSTIVGCGVWATHFIAMLAFTPHLQTGYELPATLESLLVAIGLVGVAFEVSFRWKGRVGAGVSGALFALAVGAMHYSGMNAFRTEGVVLWDRGLIGMSLASGAVFGAVAMLISRRTTSIGGVIASGLALTASICSLHFIAMGAASILPDPTVIVPVSSLPNEWLAFWVASGSILLFLVSTAALIADRQHRRGEARRLNALTNTAMEGLVVCNGDVIVTANTSFEEMAGLNGAELVGRRFAALFDDESLDDRLAAAEGGLMTDLRSASGELIPVELVARPIPSRGLILRGIAVRDLRDRVDAEARIRFLAHHDHLTHLPNRLHFNEHLEEKVQRHRRHSDAFAVLCLDLDRFKQVNDVFGHAAGDAVLRVTSARIQTVLQDADMFARLGGDEFAIVRNGPVDPIELAALCDRIVAVVEPEIIIDDQSTLIGVSVGVAIFPRDGEDARSLMRNADAALYQAKSEGRGTYRFFNAEMGKQLREREMLEFDLRNAMSRSEFKLVYQPQASTQSNEVFGFEALLRWTSPTRGKVSPDVFIPIAEETGLIMALGEWVLREACAEAASWEKPLQIAVNLSGVQLRSQGLSTLVHQILLETGLPASRLELEITETAMIQDFNLALSTLRRLKALGVKIAMDDFGTGYSSLSNLRAFPFDKIKIDRSFIHNVHQNEQGAAIVRAIVGLARGLNLHVLAEGVESQEELDFLAEVLCGEAQGFLFGHPGEMDDFAGFMSEPPAAVAALALPMSKLRRG